jgi:hypothetical protein
VQRRQKGVKRVHEESRGGKISCLDGEVVKCVFRTIHRHPVVEGNVSNPRGEKRRLKRVLN